jgi:hypothetical protein
VSQTASLRFWNKRPKIHFNRDSRTGSSAQRTTRRSNNSPDSTAALTKTYLSSVVGVRVVASLDRKRLGADCWGGVGCRTEAFSIRRLGGSRWRLRRTRCAMGFEWQRGSEGGLGRAAKRGGDAARIVGMVLKMSQSVCGEWPARRWRGGGHTSAPACGSTCLGREWWTGYEESK